MAWSSVRPESFTLLLMVVRDELRRNRLSAAGVGAVVYADDDDGVVGFVYAQQDAVVAAACAVKTFEVVAQRFAESVGVAGEGSGDEPDDGADDPRRKSLQVAACGGCDLDSVRVGQVRGFVAHRGGIPCSARRSSRETVWPSASATATASRAPTRESQ